MLASITGEMEKKDFFAETDNLKSQIKEFTHLVGALLKNQSPASSIQES